MMAACCVSSATGNRSERLVLIIASQAGVPVWWLEPLYWRRRCRMPSAWHVSQFSGVLQCRRPGSTLLTCLTASHFRLFINWLAFSEAKASVPGTSDKLVEWLSEWLIEYAIFCRGLAQHWRAWQIPNLAQGSVGGDDDARTSNMCIVHA